MNVSRVSLDRFPKVTALAARASRAVGPWLAGLCDGPAIELDGTGGVRISFAGVEPVELPAREEFLLIGSDGRRGRIAIDGWLALAVVSACLDQGAPTMLRKLGVGERGLLAARILPVIARLGGEVTLALEPAALPAVEPLACLALQVETPAARGRARLDLPHAWLASARARPLSPAGFSAAARRLDVIASVELAATQLPASDWAAARPGDAVVFDGSAAASLSTDWPAGLRIGDYCAAARLGAGGSLSLVEAFRSVSARAGKPTKEIAVMSPQSSEEQSQAVAAVAILAAAPVEVVAEIGRMTLRGDEVLGLAPGSVLSFGSRGLPIVLTAGGAPWARGELVDVEGELGVRLTELLR